MDHPFAACVPNRVFTLGRTTGWVELWLNGVQQGARKTGVRTQYSPTNKYGSSQFGAGAGFTSASMRTILYTDRNYVGTTRLGPLGRRFTVK